MGPISRLIKKIFGKKEEVKEIKPIVDLRDVETEKAIKKPDETKKVTLSEKVAIEYAKSTVPVAKPIIKDVPAKTAVPPTKAKSVHHHDDDDYPTYNAASVVAASVWVDDSSSSSYSSGSSSCSSDSYSSSSYDSGSSSCDSSSSSSFD